MKKSMQDIPAPSGNNIPRPGWSDLPSGVTVLAPKLDKVAVLPEGYPLRRSSFTRRGEHLIVQGPESPEIVVPRFFSGGNQTTLATEDGVELSRHMVLLMSNLSFRVEQALSALAAHSRK